MPTPAEDPRYNQLLAWHERLTERIAVIDRDIAQALSGYDRSIHRDRRATVQADRDLIDRYLSALERGEPLPGRWPPDLQTVEVEGEASSGVVRLAAPPPPDTFAGRVDDLEELTAILLRNGNAAISAAT
ncbi:MAG: hypothetical protein ACK2U2_04535, partial [Anaerolineae bacterium]